MTFNGFGKQSGPTRTPNSPNPFVAFSRPPTPSPPQPFPALPLQRFPRPTELTPTWGHGEKDTSKGNDAQNSMRQSTVTSFAASRNSGTSLTATITRSQHFEGNRPIPLIYTDDILGNSNPAITRSHPRAAVVNQSHIFPQRAHSSPFISKNNYSREKHPIDEAQRPLDLPVNNHNHSGSQIVQSLPAASLSNHFDEHFPPLGEAQRPYLSSAWGSRPKLQSNSSDPLARKNLPTVPSYGNSYDSGYGSMTQPPDFHGQKRNRSPPIQSAAEGFVGNIQSFKDHTKRSMTDATDFNGQKRTKSPLIQSGNEGFQGNAQSFPDYTKRPSIPSLKVSTISNPFNSDPQSHQRSLQSVPKFDVQPTATKPAGFSIPKRTRSPPLLSADQSLQGRSYPSQDDTEREMQAKAKRLQRFKTELSETVESSSDIADQKVPATRSMSDQGKLFVEFSTDSAGDFSNDNVDFEGLEPSNIITGICPDMCPASERAERERKGDLDHYERVNGDRNQTSKSLAIKKYTRTAEREANLIRPMPILQKTIDYLLKLLHQPYNDSFLGLYNFLWDRMRAIRMDLRMQHIFNRGAITMLEQMIRLHIIAMHELCEYTKGEGFSEGFDAHLNIEQMNKTSVELFQMYDDHRKKGINVHTEKEFRGYYALLKLDKHPGYKVEPAELSLDLAKMTPEIRQTPEVRFARDVARACRTGNFIAFFRLARKATFLQSCLMHAHFSKLRTQALASLHCGVQNNQGLPVAHVANWIGMEEGDIESLLEYHGFVIKEFQELYIVKEGPFLNVDTDYPTKGSTLVHMKKSRRIADDVLHSCLVASLPAEKAKENPLAKVLNNNDQKVSPSVKRGSSSRVSEEMQEFNSLPSSKDSSKVQPMLGTTVFGQPSEVGPQIAGGSHSPWGFSFPPSSQIFHPTKIKTVEEPHADALFKKTPERVPHFGKEEIPSQLVVKTTQPEISPSKSVSRTTQQDRSPSQIMSKRTTEQDQSPSQIVSMRTTQLDRSPSQIVSRTTQEDRSPGVEISYNVEGSVLFSLTGSDIEDEDTPEMNEDDAIMERQDDEVAKAKLKLILRLWKRRSSRQRELREQRQLAANTALNSLSLGPPIRFSRNQQTTFGDFDIDHIMRERYEKHERSCSKLNVSDVIAPVLSRKNPDAKCICWKLLICSQMNNPEEEKLQNNRQGSHLAGWPWLLSKVMPSKTDCVDNDDLVISSPGLSLWKKWIPRSSDAEHTCCISVIQDTVFDNLSETVSGTNGVLFLVSEHLPWESQKIQLHNLVKSLTPGSCLPLLILSTSYSEDILNPSSFIVDNLGIHEIDKSRVSSYKVGYLLGKKADGFLSDERLREGLQWLAGESPPQPSLDRIKTRNLILTHLNSSLEMHSHDICPDHCIYAFNVALDQTKLDIMRAANANAACWPCPEIDMLEEFSNEHRVAELYLPNVGWSCTARVELLTRALTDCKLPNFPDVSWLKRGSNVGKDIETQRLELENCLIRYLAETTNTMGFALAKNEASVMIQTCARLELHNSTYYIIPDWVMIFRRIFNWRLTCFSSKTLSLAYVIEEQVSASRGGSILDKVEEVQDRLSTRYHLNHPSLDEMVEVSCSLVSSGENDSLQMEGSTAAVTRYSPSHELENANDNGNMMIDASKSIRMNEEANNGAYSGENHSNKLVMVSTEEAQKLTKLLEQCNILQNKIDQKLSVYF